MFNRYMIVTCLFLWTFNPVSRCNACNDVADESKEGASIVRIIAQPKSSRPFDWQRGKRLTVGVGFVSPEDTHVVGVATEVELVATKTHKNRVEMMLRATPDRINRIRKAAEQSEYWFEIMPFHKRHIAVIRSESTMEEFAKEHKQHRPAGADDWGWGGKGGRLSPPTESELPIRKKGDAEQSTDTKTTSRD